MCHRGRKASRPSCVPIALCVIAAGGVAVTTQAAATEEGWKPTKVVEFIVPTSPGGGTDETARVLHAILERELRIEMIVANKGGAGGAVAYTYMNRFAGSGHHLSLSTLNLVTNSLTGANSLNETDITPIAQLFSEYPVFVVKADGALTSGRDLIERLRRDPTSHNFAFSPGLGGALHLATGTVLKAAAIDPTKPTLVVYQSAGQATAAVIGGHVDVGVMNPPVAIAQSRANKVRMIAVAAPKRLGGALADVPTWKEQGVDAVSASWRGVIGPRDMTRQQVTYWEAAVAKAVKTDAWSKHLAQNLRENEFAGSEKTRTYYAAQRVELKAVIDQLGIAKK